MARSTKPLNDILNSIGCPKASDVPTNPREAATSFFYGPPSALVRMARDAFEFKTSLSTRKFSMLICGDSLAARCAGFLAYGLINEFVNPNYGVALINTGPLWSGSPAPTVGVALGVTAPAVLHSIATSNPNYTIWPSGTYWEIPATGIVKATGGNDVFTASRIKAYFHQRSGGGTAYLQTSPNNSVWTTVATIDSAGATAGGIVSATVTRGQYYIRVLGATGTVNLIGLRIEGGEGAGWLGSSISQGGLSLADAALANPAIVQPIVADLDPTLITVHFDDAAEVFAANFGTFKALIGAENATWLVIGNGPKSPAAVGSIVTGAGDAISQAQCDWLRENADALGFSFFDGMLASGSWAQIDALGLGGDGTHLSASLYSGWASKIFDSIAVLTSAFEQRNKTIEPRESTFGKLKVSSNEGWVNPAGQAELAGQFDSDATGFVLQLKAARVHSFQTLLGAELARLVSFEGNQYNWLPGRVYYPNMAGALPATYTALTTGAVVYVEGNELKARDAATGVIHRMFKTGAGTPEGVVTAPVGSLFTRTDGGAGTTLYVKESGAGNTGWVAK